MIRLVQHHDWVIFVLLASILTLSLVLISLQREVSLLQFLNQKLEETSNAYLSWLIISVVYVVLLSTLISQFIPFVPQKIENISLWNLQLNKFGFSFLVFSSLYFFKIILSYCYFYAVRQQKKWPTFYFVAAKFYFVLCVFLILASLQVYYFPIARIKTIQSYAVIFAFIFVFKIFFYLFHNYNFLPRNWYYKFLYICTLQIAPILVLLKILFA